MLPIICIVGKSGSGKTALVERIIPELKRRGYRVASIKHNPHDFELDQPGKDSWRHAQAGSDAVVISSPQKVALIKGVEHDPTLGELLRLIDNDCSRWWQGLAAWAGKGLAEDWSGEPDSACYPPADAVGH